MNRRSFLASILAAAAAPAIARAESLMRIAAPKVEMPEPPRDWARSGGSILVPGHSLSVGDFISISGVSGIFRITQVTADGVEIAA